MNNFKHEEIGALKDNISLIATAIASAPRVEGVCQGLVSYRRDGLRRIQCAHPDCDFLWEGFYKNGGVEEAVRLWNAHIKYR